MRRLLPTVLLVALLLPVAACQRTVSPEGYVSETPVEKYVRNLPKAYGGQRPVVLKPPAMQPAPAMAMTQTYAEPASPMVSAPPDYTSQPLPPLAMMPSGPMPAAPMTPPGDWNTVETYDGSLPAHELSPMPTQHSYAPSPVVGNLMPPQQHIAAPSAIVTREVDYGREITVYPLDRADAPMPYIPPATTYEQPPVKVYKKQSPSGLNQ